MPMVIAGRMRCGGACRTARCRAAPFNWHVVQNWREFAVPPNGGVSSRVSEGRGWLRSDLKHAAAALTRDSRNGHCRSMSFACQLVPDVSARMSPGTSPPSQSSNPDSSVRLPHILWTLSMSCVQWIACAGAYSSRCARASREIAPVVGRGRSRNT